MQKLLQLSSPGVQSSWKNCKVAKTVISFSENECFYGFNESMGPPLKKKVIDIKGNGCYIILTTVPASMYLL